MLTVKLSAVQSIAPPLCPEDMLVKWFPSNVELNTKQLILPSATYIAPPLCSAVLLMKV